MLWLRLKRSGLHIRKQHPIGPYILDFYCAAAKLAIEVDGFAHDTGARLGSAGVAGIEGLRVIRLAARDVLRDPDGAAEAVRLKCGEVD